MAGLKDMFGVRDDVVQSFIEDSRHTLGPSGRDLFESFCVALNISVSEALHNGSIVSLFYADTSIDVISLLFWMVLNWKTVMASLNAKDVLGPLADPVSSKSKYRFSLAPNLILCSLVLVFISPLFSVALRRFKTYYNFTFLIVVQQ